LARRIRSHNRGTDIGRRIEPLVHEIESDRRQLRTLLEHLRIRPSSTKIGMALLGERLARLKPNGRVVSRTSLGRLLELEALHVGIGGKRDLWVTLQIAGADAVAGIELELLIDGADRQRALVEELRRDAARRAVADEPAGAA
jgi:hypothetical protein